MDGTASQKEDIKAVVDNDLISHSFFTYLSSDDIRDIKNRIENEQSLIVGFHKSHTLLFCAIFDIFPSKIHVREVAGHFGKEYHVLDGYKDLDIFVQGLSKFLGVPIIEYNGDREIHKMVSENFGYSRIENTNIFQKRLH